MVVGTSGGRALTMEALVMVVLDQTVVPLQAVLGDLMSRQTEEAYWEVHHLQGTTKDQVVGWVKCLTLHRQSKHQDFGGPDCAVRVQLDGPVDGAAAARA